MNILMTNDDGFDACGLRILIEQVPAELRELGIDEANVFVAAPERQQSTCSTALTLHKPLRVAERITGQFAISGTPADSVYLALSGLVDAPIDLVMSGINHGPNVGSDLMYSGTVSGAIQATQMGVPALAISVDEREGKYDPGFTVAAKVAARWATMILKEGLPEDTLININVPRGDQIKESSETICTMGRVHYCKSLHRRLDPREREYFWIGSSVVGHESKGSSDCEVIDRGGIAVTPIQLDLTAHSLKDRIEHWLR